MKSKIQLSGSLGVLLNLRGFAYSIRRIGGFLLILALAVATSSYAENSNDLSALGKHLHQRVTVETTDGQQVTGDLLRAEQNRIVIYHSGTPTSIMGESVKRVTRHTSRHTAAWVAGMAAAGLGTGFLIGFNRFDDAINSNNKVGAAALAGAGAGAAAGFGLSRIGKHEQVIYSAVASR